MIQGKALNVEVRTNAHNVVEEFERQTRKRKGLGEDGFGRTVVKGLLCQVIEDVRIGLGMIGTMYQGPRGRQYFDDISGEELNGDLIREARKEEIEEYKKHEVYIKVPVEEC